MREDDLVSTTGGVVWESQQLAEGCLVSKGSDGCPLSLRLPCWRWGLRCLLGGDASKLGQVVLELGGDVVEILV